MFYIKTKDLGVLVLEDNTMNETQIRNEAETHQDSKDHFVAFELNIMGDEIIYWYCTECTARMQDTSRLVVERALLPTPEMVTA